MSSDVLRMSALPETARRIAQRLLPRRTYAWLRGRVRGIPYTPPPGTVRFGSLRRVTPLSRGWGKGRGGLPVDRYYIERFLAVNATDVRGRVLEVGGDTYTRRFGGDHVQGSDVLHARPGNPAATIVGDLARSEGLPTAAFDCVILTQVLHVMADPFAGVRTAHGMLKPGGILLATLAGISQISRWDMERWGDYWRFTDLSARHLMTCAFPEAGLRIESCGNVLTAIAFLHGLAAEELDVTELEYQDPDYQLLITVRAVREATD